MSDALVLEHLDWARRVCRWRARSIRAVEPEDIEAEGIVGLVQAARTWRPDGGASFRTFARRRILGAITDMLRTEDYIGREDRRAVRDDRAPDWIAERGMPTRIDATVRIDRDGDVAYLATAPAIDPPQEASLELDALRVAFEGELAKLPKRLARAMRMQAKGWKLKRIGKALGVSEARACQIVKEARSLLP